MVEGATLVRLSEAFLCICRKLDHDIVHKVIEYVDTLRLVVT